MGASIHRAQNSVQRPRSPFPVLSRSKRRGSRRFRSCNDDERRTPRTTRSVDIDSPRALAASTTRPDNAASDLDRDEGRGRSWVEMSSRLCRRRHYGLRIRDDNQSTTAFIPNAFTAMLRRGCPVRVENRALCSVRRHAYCGAGLLRRDFATRGRSGLAAARKPDKKDFRKIERPARIFRLAMPEVSLSSLSWSIDRGPFF